jgi:hypothetical protein
MISIANDDIWDSDGLDRLCTYYRAWCFVVPCEEPKISVSSDFSVVSRTHASVCRLATRCRNRWNDVDCCVLASCSTFQFLVWSPKLSFAANTFGSLYFRSDERSLSTCVNSCDAAAKGDLQNCGLEK